MKKAYNALRPNPAHTSKSEEWQHTLMQLRQLRRSPLYLALFAGLSMAHPAFAQSNAQSDQDKANKTSQEEASEEDENYELGDLTVTGFAASVERSVATKRESASIVEAVYAEDIGKLPDVSIAEALARLPGLTAQRTDGRAQTISIRGLGPDFSTALLNGREQVTTGDNRGVEFDQYPSELLGAVVVYKTPESTLIGSGLAGTVDLRTIRPLESRERVLSVNARYEFNEDSSYNPDGQDDGYRASLTYVDQFNNNTLGITFGAAIQSTPNQIERFNTYGYPEVSNDLGEDGPLYVIGGTKPYVQSNDLDRVGLLGTIEYAPNDNFRTIIDLSYSDFEETQILRGTEIPLYWSSASLRDDYVVDNGLIVNGTFDGTKAVVRNDRNERDAELFTFGWNTRFEFSDLWGIESDISYSRAEREDFLLESYSGTGYASEGATDPLGFILQPNGTYRYVPTLDYADRNLLVLTDPQGWGAGAGLTQAGFINNPETEDWLAHLRLSLDRKFTEGPFSQALIGFDLSRRDKDRRIGQTFLTLPNDATTAPIPDEAFINGDVDLGFIGIPGQVVYDPRYLVDNVYVQVPIQLSSFNVPQDWQVREDVVTGFVRFDVDTLVSGTLPLTGNVGLQVVHTDQTSGGFRVAGADGSNGAAEGSFLGVQDGDKYTRFLPSLNLTLDLGNDQQLRFGASRVLARARQDQLNASLSLSANFSRIPSTDPNQAFFSASGGNPNLKPTIANTVDLSYSKFFADDSGYVSLAGFYKDLQDFVNPNDAFIFDFNAFVDDFLTPEQQAQLGTSLGTISAPTNNGKGNIWGFELSSAVPFSIFSESLDGFGLLFSASYTDSKLDLTETQTGETRSSTVPGLSEWVTNTTLYFEKQGFQARVSHRYRDEFLAEIFGLSATRITRSAASENIIDAQIGYEFQSGSLKGLNVVFQANNLTDEPFTTLQDGDGRLVVDRQQFGRNFLVGASYKFN